MDSFFKQHFGHFPVQRLLTIVFSLLLVLSVTSAAWLLISSGDRIVSKVVQDNANSTSRQATLEIARFLNTPSVIGRSVQNAVLEKYIDIDDRQATTRFLYQLPQRDADYGVSGIYIADATGNLSGIDSEQIDGTTIWSVLLSSPGDTLNKYTVRDDGTAGKLFDKGSVFDATTRPWYKQALNAQSSIWTNLYEDAHTGQPVLTWARAIRNESGQLIAVVGVDLLLSRIRQFLEQLPISDNAAIILTDQNGVLISDSFIANNGNAKTAMNLASSPQAILGYLEKQHSGIQSIEQPLDTRAYIAGVSGMLKVVPLTENIELAWRIGVFVPLRDYLNSFGDQLLKIVPLGLLAFLIVWLALQMFLRLMVKPLHHLRNSSNRIASGQFSVFIDTSCSNEVGELASSIESMRLRLKNAFSKLTEQNVRAETTLSSITDSVITIDHKGDIQYMNAAAQQQAGWPSDEAVGKPLADIFRARDCASNEMLNTDKIRAKINSGKQYDCNLLMLDKTGQQNTIECRISPFTRKNGHTARGAVMVFSDVTEQVELKSELLRQASIDDLTGLMNRRQFDSYLQQTVEDAKHNDSTHCLCYMDLDQFKVVNDTCGHTAGDELLRQISHLLQEQIRRADVIARLGGDEFALLLKRCTKEQATRVTENLLTAISAYRLNWEDKALSIGISIGVVEINSSTGSSTAALADADNACYAAKDAGRNRIHVHRSDDSDLASRRQELQMVNQIDYALGNNRFVLHTQAICPASGGASRCKHFEVLVRMLAEDGTTVPPGLFLPTAERFNQASRIDHWVVNATLEFLDRHDDVLDNIEQCSINLSGQSLGDVKFLPKLLALLEKSNVPATKICFEVTETAAIANLKTALTLMNSLRKKGCSFALDDFGSGFSSLAYLKTLPFEYLKIDGVFVRDIIDDKQDLAMVRLINEIGRTMGLKTIAEFVETDQIRLKLANLGVNYVQGYAVDKPQSIENLVADPALAEPVLTGTMLADTMVAGTVVADTVATDTAAATTAPA